MSEKLYYRLCRGLADIGTFYPVETSPYDVEKNLNQEIFKSVYYYNADQVKEAEELVEVIDKRSGEKVNRTRGVGNLTLANGERLSTMRAKTNQIIFDFDSSDIDLARKDALEIISRLNEHNIPKNEIDICFSGNKGFHCKVQTNTYFNADELKSICTVLMDGLGTTDTRVYNDARILRLPYSKHKSGLNTTPLEYDELLNLSVEDIKKLANQKFAPEDFDIRVDVPESLIVLKDMVVKNKIEHNQAKIKGLPEDFTDIDFANKPPYLSPAKYVLEMGYIPRGFGQDGRMILAASYKKAGKNITQAYYALKAVSELRAEKYGDNSKFDKFELWDNVLTEVYSDHWQGGTYSAFHPLLSEIEDKLPAYLKRKERTKIIDNASVFDKFRTFARDIDKNTIQFGIPSLDDKLRLLTGTAVGVLGVPGSGKSTLVMNLLANNSLKNETSIFYSLDMGESLVALKQVQRICNFSNDAIFEMVKNEPEKFHKYQVKAEKEFKNVHFSFKFGITPDDIRTDIMDYENRTGEKVRLVVVDYLESVTSGYSDPIMGAGIVAQQLADIANEMDVLIVVLLQTQKTMMPGDEISTMRSIKGSSVIEQCLSVAIGIYREAQQLKYQDYDTSMMVNVLKNRYGNLSSTAIGWDGAKSRVNELTKDQRLQLTQLREIKAEDAEEEAEKTKSKWKGSW